ncbi:MAG TPA: ABC transporter ATP-binding protein [Bacteroidota bacterium]|nr:ABC transporter ATP-binding protein [Bacteroidota bacterium]
MMETIAELADVTKTFGTNGGRACAVKNVSLQITRGELILLLGPSGSGKTTILTLLAGLLEPTSGHCMLFEEDIAKYPPEKLREVRANRIGFIFQNFLLIDALSVRDNIALALQFAGRSRKNALDQAQKLLHSLNILSLSDKLPNKLSQGEKQRVAIARAIANNADLIIADEPTASLESKQGSEIIQLLHRFAKEQKKCVVVASHDLRLVEFADRVIRIEDGMIVEKRVRRDNDV